MSEMDYESGSDGGGGFGFGGASDDDDEFESSFDKLGDDGESVADLEEDIEEVRFRRLLRPPPSRGALCWAGNEAAALALPPAPVMPHPPTAARC